jgi:putative solute:sodium symporter small subunit
MRDDDRNDGPAREGRAQARYWRTVCLWTGLGLLGWLLVTWTVAWFPAAFNAWTVAGAPAGYWFAAQGAIGAYLAIIVIHGWVMDRLEQTRRDTTDAIDDRPASPSAPLTDGSPSTHG